MSDDSNGSGRSNLAPDQSALGGYSTGVDMISSVVAGLLLGLGLDWWLGTNPVFTVIGIVAGFGSGFYRLWRLSAVLEEQAKERRRGT